MLSAVTKVLLITVTIVAIISSFIVETRSTGVVGATDAETSDMESTVVALQTQVAALTTQVAELSGSNGADSNQHSSSSDIAGLNDEIEFGSFHLTVTEVEEVGRLDSEDELFYAEAEGRFVIVTVLLENMGDRSLKFPNRDFVIEETYGATYEQPVFLLFSFPDEFDWENPLRPEHEYRKKFVFDVPREAAGLTFRHKDDYLGVAVSLGI
jgi:hypothetical protein